MIDQFGLFESMRFPQMNQSVSGFETEISVSLVTDGKPKRQVPLVFSRSVSEFRICYLDGKGFFAICGPGMKGSAGNRKQVREGKKIAINFQNIQSNLLPAVESVPHICWQISRNGRGVKDDGANFEDLRG